MTRTGKPGIPDDQKFLRQVDWNLLRQFYEIVQSGSVSAAARRLNTHQPSLSLALKRLEEQVGTTLCRRTAQGIELTPAGKAVFQQASDAVELIRMIPHLAAQATKRVAGTLRIAMVSDIVSRELDDAIETIVRRHPDVTLKIDIIRWRDVLEAVSSGACDVGVTYENSSALNLTYEPILRETQQLYCGRSHALFGRRLRNPGELADERFIMAPGDQPEDLSRFCRHYDIGRNTTAHADHLGEAIRLIRLGIGVGFLPTILAEPLGEKLWPILPASLLPSYFIYLVTPAQNRLSTPAQLFRTEILRRLRAKPELS